MKPIVTYPPRQPFIRVFDLYYGPKWKCGEPPTERNSEFVTLPACWNDETCREIARNYGTNAWEAYDETGKLVMASIGEPT